MKYFTNLHKVKDACKNRGKIFLNPYLTNGFSHHYQWGQSTLILGGVRCDFYFLSDFSIKFVGANRIALDVTPRSAGVTSGAILFAYVP